jgi:cytochrome c biogenesis protein CcmG, thiol:disulfide interchange protein DsbE
MARRPSLHARVALGLAIVAGGAWWIARDDGDATGPYVTVVRHESAMPVLTTTVLHLDGRSVPLDVELTSIAGAPVLSGDVVGGPLVLNLWYDTCLPCRTEMPAFQQVADQLGDRVRIVGIDPLNDADEVIAFTDEVGVRYEQLLDPDGALAAALDITSFPATVLVRADGSIAFAHLGALSADELTRAIADELGVR